MPAHSKLASNHVVTHTLSATALNGRFYCCDVCGAGDSLVTYPKSKAQWHHCDERCNYEVCHVCWQDPRNQHHVVDLSVSDIHTDIQAVPENDRVRVQKKLCEGCTRYIKKNEQMYWCTKCREEFILGECCIDNISQHVVDTSSDSQVEKPHKKRMRKSSAGPSGSNQPQPLIVISEEQFEDLIQSLVSPPAQGRDLDEVIVLRWRHLLRMKEAIEENRADWCWD